MRAGPAAAHAVAPVPGSVPAALYEPLVARLYATPDALGVAATAAAAGQVVERSLLAATTALADEQLDADAGHARRHAHPRAGRRRPLPLPPRAAARGRLRAAAPVVAADDPRPPRRPAARRRARRLARASPRTSSARSAWTRPPTPTSNTAEWARRRGALDEARAHLARAVDRARRRTRRREVQLRLRRGMLAMSAEGAGSADASADFDRCLELAAVGPAGRRDVQHADLALGVLPLVRGARPLARDLDDAAGRAAPAERSFFAPQNRAGFGDARLVRGRLRRPRPEGSSRPRASWPRSAPTTRVAAAWFVPNDPTVAMHMHLGLARFMVGDTAGAEAQPRARAGGRRGSSTSRTGRGAPPTRSGSRSWLQIETGADEPAEAALQRSSRPPRSTGSRAGR